MKRNRRAIVNLSVVVFICSYLIGCGTSQPSKQASSPTQGVEVSLADISKVLDDADRQNASERSFIYLNVAQKLIEADEIDWARSTLARLNSKSVPSDQYIRYGVLTAMIALAQGQMAQAKHILWADNLSRLSATAPKSERIKLIEMRARLHQLMDEQRESITQRIALYDLLEPDSEAFQLNQAALWQSLMALSYEDLLVESKIQNQMIPKGWYTLAALSKNNQTNLKQQVRMLERWVMEWPEHPASLQAPADLQLLKQLSEEQPKQIALLLPHSGRFKEAAEAIRDGIMAAYYDAASSEDTLPDLRIYDTSEQNIIAVYDKAVQDGAEFIIGPLEQERIEQLAEHLISTPTLALNRIKPLASPPPGLFQFGLPLEDEARQVAEQAWQDGHRRAMVIAPENLSGDRSVESFTQRWLELGGETTRDYRFSDQSGFASLIKTAVKIDASENRRNEIRSIINKNIEFEPRRRQDIDVIFLYSQSPQARQLKPILAFHYSGDIPVYAIKDIYSGEPDVKRDRDLNGIRFTTLPWFFDANLPEKKAIMKHNKQTNYQQLYALGVDAYHIHPRMRQLKEVKQAHFYGTTGRLHLNEQQHLIREQVWAQFNNGIARPMATFYKNDI